MTANVLAAIIAGGAGTRLGGVSKPLLTIGGVRIVDRQLQALGAVFDRVVIVAADAAAFADAPVAVITDRVPAGVGPLGGIDAALAALGPDEGAVVCVAGDMPFLRPASLRLLRDHQPDAVAVAARTARGAEPLFARYGRAAAATVAARLAAGAYKASRLLDALPTVYLDEAALRAVDPALEGLFNVNEPGDLAAAERMAGRS